MAGAGEGKEVKLVGIWASPFVIRARIALNIKGIDYEFLEETYGNKSELLLKSNPIYKKIPVLIHQGKPICESMIIVQYIDDVWSNAGPSILPIDHYESAFARFWIFYIDDKWIPSLYGILIKPTEEAKAEAKKEAIVGLQLLEAAFDEHCKGKPFFGGDNIGYLDIALGCTLGWMGVAHKLFGVDLLVEAKTPQLSGWADRFWSHDAVKRVIPGIEKFVEFGKMVQAMWDA